MASHSEMLDTVQVAIHELTDFYQSPVSDSFRNELFVKISELEEVFKLLKLKIIQHYEPIALRVWLDRNQSPVVAKLKCCGKEEIRLTAGARRLIRGFIKDFLICHRQGKAHGCISLDNIHVFERTAKLVNSQELEGNSETYQADFNKIKEVLEAMVGKSFPKDLQHLLGILSKGLPTGTLEAIAFNHPTFWSNKEIVQNISAIRGTYYGYGTSTRTEWNSACQIPENDIDWKSEVKKSKMYKELLEKSPTKYDELVNGLALLFFLRNAVKHRHKKFAGDSHRCAHQTSFEASRIYFYDFLDFVLSGHMLFTMVQGLL